MESLRFVISKNLVALRKSRQLTQAELAEAMSYSDKTVSKWETGETEPSIEVLKQLSDFYHVPIDEMISPEFKAEKVHDVHSHSRLAISLLGVFTLWLIATAIFVFMMIYYPEENAWLVFVYAVPFTCILLIIFNSLWGPIRHNYIYVSVLAWSVITSFFLGLLLNYHMNIWPVFLIGIPAQILIVLWSRIKKPVSKRDKK